MGVKMRQKLQRMLLMLKSYIPQALPQTPAELCRFIDETLEVSNLPTNNSFRSAIATQILHLSMPVGRVSQQTFIRTLRRSIANQVAYDLMTTLKEEAKNESKRVEETPKAVVPET